MVRYRCFESLSSGKFCVQSADFYHDGKLTANLDTQCIELLMEQEPARRSGEYETLKEAIAAHQRTFGNSEE